MAAGIASRYKTGPRLETYREPSTRYHPQGPSRHPCRDAALGTAVTEADRLGDPSINDHIKTKTHCCVNLGTAPRM